MDKAKYGSLLGAVPFTQKSEDANMEEENTADEPHATITFADMGIPTSARLQDTVIGKARPLSDISWKEIIYVVLMLGSIIAATVMTIYRLSVVPTSDSDFTFCIVLLLNAAFCVWFVIEGVLRERPSELFILTFATVIIMVYLIANYAAGTENDVKLACPLNDISRKEIIYVVLMLGSIVAATVMTIYRLTVVLPSDSDFTFCIVLLLNAVMYFIHVNLVLASLDMDLLSVIMSDNKARLIVACIFCPVLAILGLIIAWEYHTSKKLIFRTVGANEMLQTLYRNLLVFQDFLKFDLQLGGSMVVFILRNAEKIDDQSRDIIILSVGGVVTVAWFIIGFFSMSREWKIGAITFFLFSPAELAYVAYKIYDASRYTGTDAAGIAYATIACGVGAMLVHLTVIVTGVLVFRNFGAGLKEKLKSPTSSPSTAS